MTLLTIAIFSSLFLTLCLIPILSKIAPFIGAIDVPDKRKIHTKPIPRIGGLAMSIAIFVTLIFSFHLNSFTKAFLISSFIIVVFGLIDDIKNLDYKLKFCAQIIACLIIIYYGKVNIISVGDILSDGMYLNKFSSFLFTVFVIVGVTNAINLADGLDGLAAGICFLSFLCIGYLAYQVKAYDIFIISIVIASAIFGFLRFNTYPASVFMGDAGSQLLGFSGAVLSIKLTQQSLILSSTLPLLIFGFPILDTLSVMAQRIYERRSPFKPDKNHFHHKLLKIGLYHTEAVTLIYFIHSLLIAIAALLYFISDKVIFFFYIIFCLVILIGFFIVDKYKLTIKRYKLIVNIKDKLKILKEKSLPIMICFFLLRIVFYLIIIFMSLTLKSIPKYVFYIAIFLLIGVCTNFVWKKYSFLFSKLIKVFIYILIPVLVYFSQNSISLAFGYKISYELLYIFCIILAVLTLKLTRRKKGFKIVPTDYLVTFIILVNLVLSKTELKIFFCNTVILFYVLEILLGELRGELKEIYFILIICAIILIKSYFVK